MIKSNIEQSYKLSPMQLGMIFHYQLEPKAGIDIEQMVCTLNEELNISALIQSWNYVLKRHPPLRSSFRWENISEPLQDVHYEVNLPFEQHNLTKLPETEQQKALQEYLHIDRERGFDLHEAPLMRFMLFQLDKTQFNLVWTFHHIIADGRSQFIILKEVFEFYEAICQGRTLHMNKSKPFFDYVEWLENKDLSKAEIYWKNLLKGFTAPNSLNISPPKKEAFISTNNYVDQEIEIDETLTVELKKYAEQINVTLHTLVQGAWAILLSHYSNSDDVIFGAVRACRNPNLEGSKSSVGLFVNTIPIRANVSPDEHLISFFKKLRTQHINAYDFEHTPLVKILSWSDVPASTSLFESLIVFENYELNSRLREGDSSWHQREFKLIEKNIYPITLYGFSNNRLLLKISYDLRRFDTNTITRVLSHLRTLLEGIIENINTSISNLSIIPEEEKHLLLNEWNNTQREYQTNFLIHEVFESQAEKTPDKVAVIFEGKQLTYRELNQKANQLAHFLQSLGVGPEVLVGICVERSLEMVVGLFGILKAGGAYVPIDPTYPDDRIAYMLENAQVGILLSQSKLIAKLPNVNSKVFCLDTDWENFVANRSVETPNCDATLQNLAYVIYTSGSTGKPKGVMNEHHGILNRILWMQESYKLISSDNVLQKTPFSFDVSVWEFFWPLMFGACLVVARPEGHKDSDYLVQIIQEHQISTLHFVPSMLQLFLIAKNVEQCTSLRQVICSGEALPLDLQNHFFDRLEAKLHNLYGPTEAAVDVTFWECDKKTTLEIVPIGRPISNTQTYILDSHMKPVPIGVTGELHIGGVQVARGYINRPELTAEKFIPDPFSDNKKARLYKTGDLTRYLPDGNIEYLGRNDFQVKVRGFRIELGEIEKCLTNNMQIREAVVTARADLFGTMELIAYVVPSQRERLTVEVIRNFLKNMLPDYMVPGRYVILESLPLTPNGKVDRKALPEPAPTRPETEHAFVAPASNLEKKISTIWGQVLGLDQVGIEDNFFDLGGNSLLILQLANLIQKTFDMEIPITMIFQYPTISSFVKILEKNSKDRSDYSSVKNRAKKRREEMLKWRKNKGSI